MWESRRALTKSPAFTSAAIATLALGVGSAVLVFSVLYSVVLNPFPYRDPQGLAFIWINDIKRGIHEEGFSYPTYLDWKSQATTFEDIAIRGRGYSMTLAGPEPERIMADVVSANFFSILGIAPLVGAVFTAQQEDAGEHVAVISHRLARRRFGTVQAAIGQPLQMEGRIWRVIAVMPPRFGVPPFLQDVWLPAHKFPPIERFINNRTMDFFMGIARLKSGRSLAEAQTEMNAISARLAQAYPISDPEFGGFGAAVVPFDQQVLGVRLPRALWVLMGAVCLVLLVSCLNIANLLLARGASRKDEFAIRYALGAGTAHLIRQQLAEALLLAAMGGAAGLAFAAFGLQVLPLIAPANLPRFDELQIGSPVVLFAIAASLAACALFALAPAWLQARNALPSASARITGRSAGRLSTALVIAEFALSLTLATGAGLFLKSLLSVERTPPGYDAPHTLLFQLERDESPSREQKSAFYRDLLARLRALPGVEAAGAITDFFIERNPDYIVTVQGRATSDREQVTVDAVSPGFLEAIGARLIRGRFLTDSDYQQPHPAVVIVNETFARRFFPNQDALGKRFKYGTADARGPWIEIVGIVADLRRLGLEAAPVCEGFGPVIGSSMDIVVRTSVKPESLFPAIRDVVRQLDPAVPLYGLTTLDARLAQFTAERRLQTWLLSGFSLLTVVLAAVGIFGLMQYTVGMRRREIAIRAALGERASQIQTRFLKQGLAQAAAGILLGWLISAALGRAIESLLFGVHAFDLPTFAAASLLLAVVALLACWLPALTASRTNPASLLGITNL